MAGIGGADATIRIDSKIDTTGVEHGVAKLGKVLSGAGKAIGLTFAALGAGVIGATMMAFKFAESASNLSEAQNVVKETFKTTSPEIMAWAKTMGEAAGIGETAAIKNAGSMGAMLMSGGAAEAQAADMAKGLVQLAGDMSSFYNLSGDVAWEKLRAGMAGESEPLKALGINMSVANMEAYALAQGINKSWNEMTQAEQQTLRYGFIMEKTATAQGDFGRTLGESFPNQLRVAQMQLQSLGVTIGQEFMPIFLNAFKGINEGIKTGNWAQVGTSISDGIMGIINKFVEMAPKYAEMGIAIVTGLIQGLSGALPQIATAAITLLNGLIASVKSSLPILMPAAMMVIMTIVNGMLDAAPELLDLGMEMLVMLIQGIADALPDLIPKIVETVLGIVQVFIDNMPLLLDAGMQLLMGLVTGVIAALPLIAERLPQLILSIVQFITENLPKILEMGLTILMALLNGIMDNLPTLMEAIITIIPAIIEALIAMIPQLIETAMKFIPALVEGLIKALPMLIKYIPEIIWAIVKALANGLVELNNAGTKMLKDLWEGIKIWAPTFWENFKKWAKDTLLKIGEWFKGIYDSGVNLVKGLWQGIKDNAQWLWDQITGWAKGILEKVRNAFGEQSPSKEMAKTGSNLGLGLIKGFTKQDRAIQSTFGDMTDKTLEWGDTMLVSLQEVYVENLESIGYTVDTFAVESEATMNAMLDAIIDTATTKMGTLSDAFKTKCDEIVSTIEAMAAAVEAAVEAALAAIAALSAAQASAGGVSGGGGSSPIPAVSGGGGLDYETADYPDGQYWTIDPETMHTDDNGNWVNNVVQNITVTPAVNSPSAIAKAIKNATTVK